MAIGLGTAVGYLNLDISGFANGVDSAISDMGRLNGGFSTATQGLQTIGGMFTKAGTALTAGFTAPVTGATAASIKFGSEFDKQMSNVKAVTGATTEEFEAMREAAISWGEKTVYTATEAGEALYYMGLAGWDSQEAIDGLGPVLNLAAAGNLNLGRTSDIVTDALTAFGLTAQDTTTFTNVLAAAMSNSNTDVDQMGESFKYVAPVAGAFGYKIQDVALALGLFANNGVKGSQAGTGLRQALNALVNPSDKAAELMDKYGVSLFNADGSTKSFMKVMEELRGTFGNVSLNAEEVGKYIDELGIDLDSVDGETEATVAIMEKFGHAIPTTEMENLSAIVKIFGVRALPGMLSVMNASEDDFYGLAEKINGADEAFVKFGDEVYTIEEALERFGNKIYNDPSFEILGSAAGMAATQIENLSGDWDKFTSALGTSKILIFDMVKGALREFLQSMTDLIMRFNNLDEEQREQIVKWALVLASIGPVFVIIGKLITGVISFINTLKLLKGAFDFVSNGISLLLSSFKLIGTGVLEPMAGLTSLQTVLASLTGPIIAVIALIVVLVAAFVNLWKTNEDFRNKIIEIWESIKEKFEEAGERIVEIFNELGFNFEDFKELMATAIDFLKKLWDGFCELLAPVFVGAFEIIGDVIGGFIDLFVGVIEVIAGIVKGFKDGDWSMLWKGIYDIAKSGVDTIINVLDHLAEAVWNVVQITANWLGNDWNMSWDEAKQAVKNWFDSVVQWVQELPDNIGGYIREFVSNTIQWFSELPGKISEFFTSIWDATVEWGANMVSKAIEVGTNFLDNIIQWFSELPNKIAYFIGYTLGLIIKWSIDMVNKAREMGTNFLNNVVDFFTQLPGKVYMFIISTLDYVKKWSVDMSNKAREMAQNFLNNVIVFFVQLPGKVKGFLASVLLNVLRWKEDMKNTATDAAKGFFDNIVSGLIGLPNKMKEIGSNIVDGVWEGISSGWRWLTDKVSDLANSLLDGVKDALDIGSPSKKFRDQVGRWIPPGIGEGFSEAMPALIRDMQNELDKGVDKISVEDIDVDTSVQSFVDTYSEAFESVVIWFETLEERMAVAVEKLANYFNYLMYVRKILGSDDDFRDFVLGRKDEDKSNKPIDVDTPVISDNRGGDTFIFQSPKTIDEVQAARLLRNTKRDLAEGF